MHPATEPFLSRSDSPSRHRGAADHARCAARTSSSQEVALTRDPGTDVRRARGAGLGHRRRRRRAGAARHHRPAPGRSDPARLRRQRLARAAHAADGDSRLRRGAARRARRMPRSTQKFLEIIARHTTRMERLVKDLLRLARLDARQEALEMARCDVRQIFSGVIADLVAGDRGQGPARGHRRAARCRAGRRRSGQAARHRPQSGRERRQLLARWRRRHARGVARERAVHDHRRRFRAGDSAGGSRRACSSGSIAWTSRARGPAGPGSAWRS